MAVQKDNTEKYMREAIKQAKKAAAIGEVPIGCVIVRDGTILARGYNRRNIEGSTLAHAEIIAIKKASKKLQDWRLEDCELYVTLEPCPMCAGSLGRGSTAWPTAPCVRFSVWAVRRSLLIFTA